MSTREPMICDLCGAAMNHQAIKLDYGDDADNDSVFDGVLKEVHTCSHCSHIQLRKA